MIQCYFHAISSYAYKSRLSGKHGQHGNGQRGHGHVKIPQKAIKAENEKKSYQPFYKVTILCEIIVRVRVRVTVRVRLSMLSVSVLSVFSRYVVRVFQITTKVTSTVNLN